MGAALNLPANWRMHASTAAPAWASAVTALTQQASSGSPTAGGTYNWGSTASERAAGAMTSGSFASPNDLLAYFSNTGASNITSISIAYQAERYRVNSASASIAFLYSLDGSTWIPVAAGDIPATAFPTGTSAYTFASPLIVPVAAFNIAALAIPPGGAFYLRWSINTTGASSQGIGVDDVSVSAVFAGTAPTVGFTSASSSLMEGGTANIGVSMNTAPASNVVVTVSDLGMGSASSGSDYTTFTAVQLSFPTAGSYPQTQNVSVTTTDDAFAEPAETVALGLALTSGTVDLSNTGHTLTLNDNDATATGCSSSLPPYVLPILSGASTRSLLTVGDQIGTYKLVGSPDGLGAFDNGDGTFTLLANHELNPAAGVARAHGSTGAFVSRWVIDKTSLCVLSGQDLIQSVRLWNGSAFTTGTTAFNRFCSADLPAPSAFYNAANGKGTQARIFMNGEEGGAEGRAFAHIVTGAEAGITYQLPWLGRCNMENAVASPTASDKTVVVTTDDATPGQVYVYIGTKQNTGSDIEKAGLRNGHLFGVAVNGFTAEVTGSFPAPGTAFSLVDLGDVHGLTGAQINTNSNSAGITNFLRPEDGAWDPAHPNDFYFNTTAAFSSPSRLWKLHFTDPLQPELGGTITAVLDGTEGQKMLDNLTIDTAGRILLQEDVGNNAHLGKLWLYDIATDALTLSAQHDPARFITGGATFLTQDEESSGILDVSSILGPGNFLLTQMAHYATTTELVEGGQLLLLNMGGSVNVNMRAFLEGPYDTGTGTMGDALRANGLLPVAEPYTALGYTFTAGNTGTTTSGVLANTDAANAIVDWVVVELRSAANSATVVASRSALLQRDGDVVAVNGSGPVSFPVPNGMYHLALLHRNHLGAMTASPVALSAAPAVVDLSSSATATWGTSARKTIGTVQALWAGDATFNGEVKYAGTGNDRDPILTAVGSTTPNNTAAIYSTRDVNLNGQVKYTGTGNDRDPILMNVGSTTPNNVRVAQLP